MPPIGGISIIHRNISGGNPWIYPWGGAACFLFLS